jgi:hypothetical protein
VAWVCRNALDGGAGTLAWAGLGIGLGASVAYRTITKPNGRGMKWWNWLAVGACVAFCVGAIVWVEASAPSRCAVRGVPQVLIAALATPVGVVILLAYKGLRRRREQSG